MTSTRVSSAAGAAGRGLRLAIDQIEPYERNPRRCNNPEYDRIKASIRAHGLDQPLVVTQRSGAEHYIVHSGGNTRLRVLKELYRETRDERFATIECVFKPWQTESDVLVAHLRENDLRGNLTFIDKARAVIDASQLLAEEFGLESLSQRRLEAELRHLGYGVSHSLISQMEYAVDRLLPLIPKALNAGLGRRQVEGIRRLERSAAALWRRYSPDEAGDFAPVFAALCQRYDNPDWDGEGLRSALETEIAEQAEVHLQTIRVALEAELAGREIIIPEPDPEPVEELHEPTQDPGTDSGGARDPPVPEDTLSEEGIEPDATLTEPGSTHTSDPSTESQGQADTKGLSVITDGSVPTDLKSLRGRAWVLATRLAQRNGLGDLVVPTSGQGLGFVLRDVPDPALVDQLDEESLCQITTLWWQLAACCELTYAPREQVSPALTPESVLHRALTNEDAALLFKSVWTLDPAQSGYRLWRLLNDSDWQDLLRLMDTYRRIRLTADDTGAPVWE